MFDINSVNDYSTWILNWRKEYFSKVSKLKELKAKRKSDERNKKYLFYRDFKDISQLKFDLTEMLRVRREVKKWFKENIQPLDDSDTISFNGIKEVVFHFNKKAIEDSNIPSWILKIKGKTYYVNHVNCNKGWETKETPDNPSTKGSIKIKNCDVIIKNGEAYIY